MATTKRIVAPAVSPIVLTQAKDHLRVTDSAQDSYIEGLIEAATALLDGDGWLGRAMITQTWAQWVSQSPGRVRLAMTPFQSLVAVNYYDAEGTLQTAPLGDYETRREGDFVIVQPKDGSEWPNADTRQDAIQISYVAGFGDSGADVPAGVKHAILMLVGFYFYQREAVSDRSLSDAPMGVQALIEAERVRWYG